MTTKHIGMLQAPRSPAREDLCSTVLPRSSQTYLTLELLVLNCLYYHAKELEFCGMHFDSAIGLPSSVLLTGIEHKDGARGS